MLSCGAISSVIITRPLPPKRSPAPAMILTRLLGSPPLQQLVIREKRRPRSLSDGHKWRLSREEGKQSTYNNNLEEAGAALYCTGYCASWFVVMAAIASEEGLFYYFPPSPAGIRRVVGRAFRQTFFYFLGI